MDLLITFLPQNRNITNNPGWTLQCNCKKAGDLLKSISYYNSLPVTILQVQRGLWEHRSLIWLFTKKGLEKQQLKSQHRPSAASCSWDTLKVFQKKQSLSQDQTDWLNLSVHIYFAREWASICNASNRKKPTWLLLYLMLTKDMLGSVQGNKMGQTSFSVWKRVHRKSHPLD